MTPLLEAIIKAGYKPKDDILLGLDAASSEFFDKEKKKYILGKKSKNASDISEKSSEEMVEFYKSLVDNYPIITIEDGLDENDWTGWKLLSEKLSKKIFPDLTVGMLHGKMKSKLNTPIIIAGDMKWNISFQL
jgi:enolase